MVGQSSARGLSTHLYRTNHRILVKSTTTLGDTPKNPSHPKVCCCLISWPHKHPVLVQPPICMGNSTFPGLVYHAKIPSSCQLLVCTTRPRSGSNMYILANKDSLELTLTIQTPEVHGAGHASVDMTWWESQQPALHLAPSRQKHTSLCFSLPKDTQATPTDSATLPPLLTWECSAITVCRGRELPTRPQLLCLTVDQVHAKTSFATYSSVCCLGLEPPAQLRQPSTTAIQVSCIPCREGRRLGKRCWVPKSCMPLCASGSTSCSFMSIPNTAPFPLNYNTAGEDVTNVKKNYIWHLCLDCAFTTVLAQELSEHSCSLAFHFPVFTG